MQTVDHLMHSALSEKIFPGAVLLVARKGRVDFFEAYGWANLFTREKMQRKTYFDLASLTKPLATTLAVMKLIDVAKLALDQPLEKLLPEFANSSKAHITIEMLLRHTSGYPAHRPYYGSLNQIPLKQRQKKLFALLCDEALVNPINHTTVYSDLGFMLLAEIIQRSIPSRLDQWLADHIYTPIGLTNLFFNRHFEDRPTGSYAATEFCPYRHMLLCGAVHDDNAYTMGGVCGHSGLFGTAEDVKQLLTILLNAYHGKSEFRFLSPQMIQIFFHRPSQYHRPLGFDAPTVGQSSSGRHFSWTSVGHLGYTGTSFWVDLYQEIIVILLTNRVHPHRSNDAIRRFRPKIHDMIMVALGSD